MQWVVPMTALSNAHFSVHFLSCMRPMGQGYKHVACVCPAWSLVPNGHWHIRLDLILWVREETPTHTRPRSIPRVKDRLVHCTQKNG
jgi:hypothetical protein